MATRTASRPDRRERLLSAGLEAFSETSYEEVSVDEIADRAGVAHGLLFHYFGSKRKFYVEVLRREIEQLLERFATNPHRDPRRWLRYELDTYLEHVTELSSVASRLLRGGFGGDADVHSLVDWHQEQTVRRFLDFMGIEQPTPLLHVALRGWVAFAMETAHKWLVADPSLSRARIRRLLAETLAGVLAAVVAADPRSDVDPGFFRGA